MHTSNCVIGSSGLSKWFRGDEMSTSSFLLVNLKDSLVTRWSAMKKIAAIDEKIKRHFTLTLYVVIFSFCLRLLLQSKGFPGGLPSPENCSNFYRKFSLRIERNAGERKEARIYFPWENWSPHESSCFDSRSSAESRYCIRRQERWPR